jgi:hypothetical protein
MSDQTFQILCPACKSVVPPDAPGCPTCAASRAGTFAAASSAPAPSGPAWARTEVPELPLKEYHRLVRDNHRSIVGGGAASLPSSRFRARLVAYTPGVLLVLGVLAGAAKAIRFF